MPFARVFRSLVPVLLLLLAVPAFAQQTGSVSGKVIASDGAALPGVTVEARSSVLPTPRVTVTGSVGEYRLPALPPGNYEITFVLSGMANLVKQAEVQLQQNVELDATMTIQGVTETVEVTATATLIERDSSAVKSSVGAEQISQLPVGQQYRDLVKLIPGVMYTQDGTRGPSAGASGQDNAYKFDGVNVTLPLFGTMSSEASSHDIAQVTTLKGGARAVDFERAGGFSIDSVSKSGTNRFAGQVSFQFQDSGMVAEVDPRQTARYDQDRTWITLNGGGPAIPNKLYFYGSYYRPEIAAHQRVDAVWRGAGLREHAQRGLRQADGTPTASTLFNVSYRYSHRLDKGDTFGQTTAPTAGSGVRGLAEDRHGRRLVGHQREELRQRQVHLLLQPELRAARQRRRRHAQHERRARAWTSAHSTRSAGSPSRRRSRARPRTTPSSSR